MPRVREVPASSGMLESGAGCVVRRSPASLDRRDICSCAIGRCRILMRAIVGGTDGTPSIHPDDAMNAPDAPTRREPVTAEGSPRKIADNAAEYFRDHQSTMATALISLSTAVLNRYPAHHRTAGR